MKIYDVPTIIGFCDTEPELVVCFAHNFDMEHRVQRWINEKDYNALKFWFLSVEVRKLFTIWMDGYNQAVMKMMADKQTQ